MPTGRSSIPRTGNDDRGHRAAVGVDGPMGRCTYGLSAVPALSAGGVHQALGVAPASSRSWAPPSTSNFDPAQGDRLGTTGRTFLSASHDGHRLHQDGPGVSEHLRLYTDSNEVFGPNGTRSQDQLCISDHGTQASTPGRGARWTSLAVRRRTPRRRAGSKTGGPKLMLSDRHSALRKRGHPHFRVRPWGSFLALGGHHAVRVK